MIDLHEAPDIPMACRDAWRGSRCHPMADVRAGWLRNGRDRSCWRRSLAVVALSGLAADWW